jgi:hypothetical protein
MLTGSRVGALHAESLFFSLRTSPSVKLNNSLLPVVIFIMIGLIYTKLTCNFSPDREVPSSEVALAAIYRRFFHSHLL